MKHKSFRIGETVSANIIEIVSSDTFIASFDGDLYRIKNQTQTQLKVGQEVRLVVMTIKPLGFRLCPPRMHLLPL